MAEAAHTEIEARRHDDDHEHHSNTVIIRGRQITVEGGIYTVVFGGLANFDRHRSLQRRMAQSRHP